MCSSISMPDSSCSLVKLISYDVVGDTKITRLFLVCSIFAITSWQSKPKMEEIIGLGNRLGGKVMHPQLTLCLYLFRLSRDLTISKFSSVSSLNDTTNAFGTQRLTNGANIFGTSCNDIVGAPCPDCILCVGIISEGM